MSSTNSHRSQHQQPSFHNSHNPTPAVSLTPSPINRNTENSPVHKQCCAGLDSRLRHHYTADLHHNQPEFKPRRKPTMNYQSSHITISASHIGFAAPDLQAFALAQQGDLSPWMMATVIEDDDLTFGGKSLSTWYEEDRRRLSVGDNCNAISANCRREEEPRGRPRERHGSPDTRHEHHKKSRATRPLEESNN